MGARNYPVYETPTSANASATVSTNTLVGGRDTGVDIGRRKSEMFYQYDASYITWDDLSVQEGDDGVSIVYKIYDKVLSKKAKDPPSAAYLKQVLSTLNCGISNPTKEKMLKKLATVKLVKKDLRQSDATTARMKADNDSIIIRLINIVFSDLFYEQYTTLDHQMTKNDLTQRMTNARVRDKFWTDVQMEYSKTTPDPVYDTTIGYGKNHPWFDSIDPSMCFHLKDGKAVRFLRNAIVFVTMFCALSLLVRMIF